jgi:hypothetical protein
MNKRIKIFLALLVPAIFLVAQNSGYRGKKLSLNYSLYTFSALTNPNEFGNHKFYSFNTCHHANLDIAVGRRICLGASFEYIHTGFYFTEDIKVDYPNEPYSSAQFGRSSSQGKMEMYGVGIYAKFFFKGNIAPLGTYLKPEITMMLYKVYPGVPVVSGVPAGYADPVFLNNSPYKTFAISLELGQNRILFNRMFIEYGIRLGMMPSMLNYLQGNEITNDEYLKAIPQERLAYHYLINVKLGIGVLLF